MSLAPGKILAHYRLLEQIGAGGMGVVWRALDQKLGREVAIKVLPGRPGAGAESLQRFEREARLLAALNHPHVASIHGLEHVEGHTFLVLELVDGPGLDQRLTGGPLPVAKALEVCRDVAAALAAAHDQGIIHRDLKPANVRISSTGRVKVLDFGLAKLLQAEVAVQASTSPTLTTGGTRTGSIMGTAAYMSPEQARGEAVDRRADMWAFGCLLYECLTGRRAFPGDTLAEAMAGILEHEPDWSLLPAATPDLVRRLLARCLSKDPARRMRDAGDARLEIEEALAGPVPAPAVPGAHGRSDPAPRRFAGPVAAAIAALLAGLAAGVWLFGPTGLAPVSRDSLPLITDLVLPGDAAFQAAESRNVAIAPDGQHVAYVLESATGEMHLWTRDLHTGETRRVSGSRAAAGPFFSPDGRWIAYFDLAQGRLEKVLADGGGSPSLICPAPPSSRGGAWAPDGRIVFTRSYNQGLYTVSAAGGEPQPLTRLGEREKSHRLPVLLADGKSVAFVVGTADISSFDEATIASVPLEGGERRTLVEGGTQPRWSATSHLVFARGSELLAAPFDAATGKLASPPRRILQGVATTPEQGVAQYDISATGVLSYAPGGASFTHMSVVEVDTAGHQRDLGLPPRNYQRVRLSPDETRLLLGVEGANADSWVYDLARKTLSRLTAGWDNELPIWSADGRRFIYLSSRNRGSDLYWQEVDGTGTGQPLTRGDRLSIPESVTPDGESVLVFAVGDGTGMGFASVSLQPPHEARQVSDPRFNELFPAVSPDGGWLAFVSDRSGRQEVYITSFPETGRRWQISSNGGDHPLWSRDGRTLYYRQEDTLMAVDLGPGPQPDPGRARELFHFPFVHRTGMLSTFDLAPGGQGFILLKPMEAEPVRSLRLVLHWASNL